MCDMRAIKVQQMMMKNHEKCCSVDKSQLEVRRFVCFFLGCSMPVVVVARAREHYEIIFLIVFCLG